METKVKFKKSIWLGTIAWLGLAFAALIALLYIWQLSGDFSSNILGEAISAGFVGCIWLMRALRFKKNSRLSYTETRVSGSSYLKKKRILQIDELLVNVDITYKRGKICISNTSGYFEIAHVKNAKEHVKRMNEYKQKCMSRQRWF